MWTLLSGLTFLGYLLLSSSPVFAAALESSRGQITASIDQNAVTADNNVKYLGYVPGEWIPVTLEYSATCNVVFSGLTRRVTTAEITNVSGTPTPGRAADTGSVTFDLRVNRLNETSTGTKFGLARLDLALGVDKDCNLATGDPDGIDLTTTIRVLISVSTDSP